MSETALANEADPMSVLVVDDSSQNLKLIAQVLSDDGIRVRLATSGEVGIRSARHSKPDLILLDVIMAGMGGYEVCEILKADNDLCDIPVIFISALDSEADKVKAFELGGVDYVEKPLRNLEILARVRTHLRIAALLRQQQAQNRALNDAYVKLRDLERLRDSMVTMAAHDMRGPVTVISGYLHLFRSTIESTLDPASLSYLAAIDEACQNLAIMINNMLDVSRLEAASLGIVPEHTDLASLIRSRVVQNVPGTERASLVLEESPDSHLIACDPGLILRVLDNLISNAQRYAPVDSRVGISLLLRAGEVEVSVRDSGPGIGPEHHDAIFDKFYQVAAGESPRSVTSGLGLTFCKLVVEAHGGRIGVDSGLGEGCRFWFTLPD